MSVVLIGSLGLAYLTHRKLGQLADEQRELREENRMLLERHHAELEAEGHVLEEAGHLDALIKTSNAPPVVKASWRAWLVRTRQLQATPQNLERVRRELAVWRNRVQELTGRAVHKPGTTTVGADAPAPAKPKTGLAAFPWYGWLGVGAAVAAAGYGAYRWKKGRESARDALFAKYDTTRIVGPYGYQPQVGTGEPRNPLRMASYRDLAESAPAVFGPQQSVSTPRRRQTYALTRRDDPFSANGSGGEPIEWENE